MKFTNFELEHFMSYRGRQTLPLADLGLTLVTGRNEMSAAADSNGAGKSALFDALTWGLFGETLRGMKGDAVANRHTSEPCRVAVNFEVDGKRVSVERKRRPGAVRLQVGADVWENEEANGRLEEVLGFGLNTFRHGAVFSQGAFRRFAAADNKEQLRVLDEIHGLDFRDSLQKAKAWREEWRAKFSDAERELSQFEERNRSLGEQLERLDEERERFESDKRWAVEAAEMNVSSAQETLGVLNQEVEEATRMKPHAANIRAQFNREQEAAKDFREAQLAFTLAEKADQAVFQEAMKLKGRVDRLLAHGTCPTCLGSVEDQDAVKLRFRPEIETMKLGLSESKKALREASEALAAAEKKLPAKPLNEAGVNEVERLSDPKTMERLKTAVRNADAELKRAADALQQAKARKFQGGKVRQAIEVERAKLVGEVAKWRKILGRAEATVQAAEYWVEGFGDRGIRKLLFESVSDYLTARVAQHLQVLAAGEVDAAIGTAKKGRWDQISVRTSWVYGAGDYLSASSGQDRRVDLAVFAALQDLAESQAARGFPFRVYDEPSDALDTRGQEQLAEWIEAQSAGHSSTFVITHSPTFVGLLKPERIWSVVLGPDGARVEY